MFKHTLLTEPELQKFMVENEEFLLKVLQETGRTNLSDIFLNYLKNKQKLEIESQQPKDVMIPPSLMSDSQSLIQKNNELIGNLSNLIGQQRKPEAPTVSTQMQSNLLAQL